jgi:hypothetical protein
MRADHHESPAPILWHEHEHPTGMKILFGTNTSIYEHLPPLTCTDGSLNACITSSTSSPSTSDLEKSTKLSTTRSLGKS